MTDEAILDNLNEPQRQAVTHVGGPVLVIAGAGSGKTRVITRRVAWMINQGIPPWSILAITFTNKAAGEMRERVAQAMGRGLRDFGQLIHNGPTICTFHSLCLRILKAYAGTVGLKPNFTILDVADQQKLVKAAIEACHLDPKRYSASQCHSVISSNKNKLITPEGFASQSGGFVEQKLVPLYAKYQALLTQNNAVDFDDLLMLTALAFKKHPAMLAELQDRFQYMLIDEYQDTNHAQYIIAHALAMKHRNLCVVGDPDQSIYAWRGADLRNILDFEKDYPDALVVRLEQNYRSSKRILEIASRLIEHNSQRKKKSLWTDNEQGPKARIIACADERDEAQQVRCQLRDLHEQGVDWNQMAIFYRINAMSRVMEDALRRDGIPYEIARGVEFYGRKEIKDVLAYLRVVVNPNDEVNLERIINTPTRGIGGNTIAHMQAHAIAHGVPLMEVLANAHQITGLSKKAINSATNLAALFRRWRELAGIEQGLVLATSVQAIIEAIVKESGLEEYYKKQSEEEVEGGPIANIDELISSAAEFDEENPDSTLETYLHQVSLVSDADHRGSGGAVTLMTLHAAKGLEFPIVAMIGMEQGILPHERVKDDPSQLEEERRLCFVGVTRAQQQLILTRAQDRMIRGMRNRQEQSPFLREMPSSQLELLESPNLMATGGASGWGGSGGRCSWGTPRRPENTDDFSYQPSEPKIRRGQRVRHPAFGDGTVSDVSGMGQHTRVIIDFPATGRKTLILEYARLTILD